MRNISNIVIWFLLLLCGCTAPLALVPAGINVILLWKNGVATKYYTGNSTELSNNLKDILNELSHSIEEKNNKIISKSDNHTFNWEVKQEDKNVCKITCRIDTFGDKEYAELVFKKLDTKLGLKVSKIVDESTDKKWKLKIRR